MAMYETILHVIIALIVIRIIFIIPAVYIRGLVLKDKLIILKDKIKKTDRKIKSSIFYWISTLVFLIILYYCGLPHDFGFFRDAQGTILINAYTYHWDNNGLLIFGAFFWFYYYFGSPYMFGNDKKEVVEETIPGWKEYTKSEVISKLDSVFSNRLDNSFRVKVMKDCAAKPDYGQICKQKNLFSSNKKLEVLNDKNDRWFIRELK